MIIFAGCSYALFYRLFLRVIFTAYFYRLILPVILTGFLPVIFTDYSYELFLPVILIDFVDFVKIFIFLRTGTGGTRLGLDEAQALIDKLRSRYAPDGGTDGGVEYKRGGAPFVFQEIYKIIFNIFNIF